MESLADDVWFQWFTPLQSCGRRKGLDTRAVKGCVDSSALYRNPSFSMAPLHRAWEFTPLGTSL